MLPATIWSLPLRRGIAQAEIEIRIVAEHQSTVDCQRARGAAGAGARWPLASGPMPLVAVWTGPEIVPPPPSVPPVWTVTSPVPVAEPLEFAIRSVPALIVVPPL